jgi:hypothetical protein
MHGKSNIKYICPSVSATTHQKIKAKNQKVKPWTGPYGSRR